MGWRESEIKGYEWYKKNIDPQAIYKGGEDSTCSDIFSPKYNCYIEVKDITNGARCGQFTESTIRNNPFAADIYAGSEKMNVHCFIRHHYAKKNVRYFIIIDNENIAFYHLEEMFLRYKFSVQNPYAKRSGTRQAPKKDMNLLLKDADFELRDGRVYCTNNKRWGEYYSLIDTFDYFIGKSSGELRKRATTKNMTWHLLVEKIPN